MCKVEIKDMNTYIYPGGFKPQLIFMYIYLAIPFSVHPSTHAGVRVER